jgi:hypothetical protein
LICVADLVAVQGLVCRDVVSVLRVCGFAIDVGDEQLAYLLLERHAAECLADPAVVSGRGWGDRDAQRHSEYEHVGEHPGRPR